MVGTGLLALAVVSTVAANRAAAVDDLDNALRASAAATASDLTEYFDRARSVNLLLANDSALRQFEPGTSGVPNEAASAEAGAAMAYLEKLYPGRISEACLINRTGTEIARVVKGVVAPAEELSTEEASAPFFAPTFRLPAGRVYQSAPYLSADTSQWVIANSSALVDSSGTPWALVHFEVALSSFQPTAAAAGQEVAIVDTASGRALLRSGRPLDADAVEVGTVLSSDRRALIERAETVTTGVADGQRMVVDRLPAQPDNVNGWAVVVSAPADRIGWWASVGAAPLAMAAAAALLLGCVAWGLRGNHRRLREVSLTDELTALPNRRLLTERTTQALGLGARRNVSSAVLLIDLDRFKQVNDTLGHQYGDQLLREVAARLDATFRTTDTVARLGGDEFAVLLPEVADRAAAVALGRRALEALREPVEVHGVWLTVEASIGIALAPEHGVDGNALMRAADVAMYEAKEARCGVVVYDRHRDGNTISRLGLVGELRRALAADELILHYQPKVDVADGRVCGAEALVRWDHPVRGLLAPAEFITVAEDTGLIVPLTLRTLDLAVAQCRHWLDAGQRIPVAVNLSPRCLVEADLSALVQAVLDRHQLPAELLRLELTESTVLADPTRAFTVVTALRQLGLSISIDDFGTGYSSMAHLKRLPVDELKIDRSFIKDMLAEGSDAVLVRSSINLGHDLGLSVVAEGVEDEETLAALSALGCDVAQGYHLGRPMTPSALDVWLGTRRDAAIGAVPTF